jgi:myo-inositol-1(or 4)-monophosphatase
MEDATRRATVAERAARAGGAVALERFRTDLTVETKADATDPVTEADREAQAAVVASLHEAFPSDAFVCEEEATPVGEGGIHDGVGTVEIRRSLPETGEAWVVDPIDGTANFVRGGRFWATAVAAVVDGDPVAAATYLPAQEDVYTAGPEETTRNGDAVSVSGRSDPEAFAVALIGRWTGSTADQYVSLFRACTRRFGDVRRLGSMQGVLALVAAGGLDAAFMPGRPHPWDAVAGVHLVRSAGGTATDVGGEPWHHASEGLVVSNGVRHGRVLDAVREAVHAAPEESDCSVGESGRD